jgi:hypothetical protein
MKHLMIGLLFALGCGSKGGVDGKLDELDKIKGEMCDCKDKQCVMDVHGKYLAWKSGNSKDEKLDKDQDDRLRQLKAGMRACEAHYDTAPAAGSGN